jgi:hypothetical protein
VELSHFLITLEQGAKTVVEGNIANGTSLPDIIWDWTSSVACFPGNFADQFLENTILYETVIPAFSKTDIRLKPESLAKMGMFANFRGEQNKNIPPELLSCICCIAD